MVPIIKKELRTYFNSMMGYIFLGFLVLLTAIYFSLVCIANNSPNYNYVLSGTSILFLILIPALTMRLFAEEARQKTDQLLYTSPLTILQIVVGKYLAAFLLFIIGMGITMLFPIVLSGFGELPVQQIVGSYVGYILMGCCFIGVGLFVSVLTENQIVAAVATFATLFLFYIMDSLANSMPSDRGSSLVFLGLILAGFAFLVFDSTKNMFAGIIVFILTAVASGVAYLMNNYIFDGLLVKVLKWFSILTRFSNFDKGIFNVADIIYYITFSIAFIYLTINVIEKRRWR